MFTVILVNVWRGLPFFAITLLAGLVAIPRELYEAAQSDGAGPIARFRYITLPLLMPVLAVVILFSTIFTLSDFNIVYVLTRGGPMNMTHLFATYSFPLGLQGGQIGQGAAVSLFLFPMLRGRVRAIALSCARRRFMSRKAARGAPHSAAVHGLPAVLPYVLFALFPLYFMLVTSLKSNAELYDVNAIPFLDLARAHRRPLPAPVDETAFWSWLEQPDRQLGVDGDLGRLERARRVPAGAAPICRGDSFGLAIFITYLVPPSLLFLPLTPW